MADSPAARRVRLREPVCRTPDRPRRGRWEPGATPPFYAAIGCHWRLFLGDTHAAVLLASRSFSVRTVVLPPASARRAGGTTRTPRHAQLHVPVPAVVYACQLLLRLMLGAAACAQARSTSKTCSCSSGSTARTAECAQVRRTPCRPRSWADFSLAWLCSHRIARANLPLLCVMT